MASVRVFVNYDVELMMDEILRERWDIARGVYDRAVNGVARPTISGTLDYIEVRIG